MKTPRRRRKKIVVEAVLPSWNRVLNMNRFQRKKLRDIADKLVAAAVKGKQPTEVEVAEWTLMIRPSIKNKKALNVARSAAKRKG